MKNSRYADEKTESYGMSAAGRGNACGKIVPCLVQLCTMRSNTSHHPATSSRGRAGSGVLPRAFPPLRRGSFPCAAAQRLAGAESGRPTVGPSAMQQPSLLGATLNSLPVSTCREGEGTVLCLGASVALQHESPRQPHGQDAPQCALKGQISNPQTFCLWRRAWYYNSSNHPACQGVSTRVAHDALSRLMRV